MPEIQEIQPLSFEERFKARVEQERQRRASIGMDVGEGWASPEWLNQLRSEMLQADAQKRSDELSDPNSKYYTDYFKKLRGTLSAQSSLNSLLGLNRAMGLSMTSSATIANEQRNALEGRITDYARQATQDFAASNIGQANSLLGLGLQNTQSMKDYYFQKEQFEASKKFDWGSLLKVGAQIGSMFLSKTDDAAIADPTKMGGGQSFINNNPTWQNKGLSNWGYGG